MANTSLNPSDKNTGVTLTNSNLTATNNNNVQPQGVRAVDGHAHGKFYWELTYNQNNNVCDAVGICNGSCPLNTQMNSSSGQSYCCVAPFSGGTIWNSGSQPASLGTITTGSLICIACDTANHLIWFRLGTAGNWNNSGTANPATGVGGITYYSDAAYPLVQVASTSSQITANFGDSTFSGTVPSGFTSGFPPPSGPISGVVTQIVAEEWAQGTPVARATQVVSEEWAQGTPAAQLSQFAIEEWASIATPPAPPPVSGGNSGGSKGGGNSGNGNGNGSKGGGGSKGKGNTWQPWGLSPLRFGPNVRERLAAKRHIVTPGGPSADNLHFALSDIVETPSFSLSTATDHLSFALTDVVESAAFTLSHLAFDRLHFALTDIVETAAFKLGDNTLHFALTDVVERLALNLGANTLRFAATDVVERAAFDISANAPNHLSFALSDIVETAAFAISTATADHLSFALSDIVESVDPLFTLSAATANHLSFALSDAVESAAFVLVQEYPVSPINFPVLPGLGFPVHRRPTWRTIIASHPSGGEKRTRLWEFPLWEFELTIDGLAVANEFALSNLGPKSFQELLGFYLEHGGQLTTFLFFDPIFNAQTAGPVGTGDGTTTDFYFMRTVDGASEPASFVTGTPIVYLNGVAQTTGWSLVSPNYLVFSSAPASGAVITADFSYMFLCRFLEDTGDYEQLLTHLFDMKSLKLRQVRTS